jgi:hypothetical protein
MTVPQTAIQVEVDMVLRSFEEGLAFVVPARKTGT